MYIKKSNGSRIELWGTPASTFVHVDCTTSYYASVIAPLYFYTDIYKIRVQDRFLRNFLKKSPPFSLSRPYESMSSMCCKYSWNILLYLHSKKKYVQFIVQCENLAKIFRWKWFGKSETKILFDVLGWG